MCADKFSKLLAVGVVTIIMSAGNLWAGTLVDDLANAQLEKQMKEARGEDKPKTPSSPVLPNLPRVDSGKRLTLVAVYGLGDRLLADIECQGAVFSVKAMDTVDGWKVTKIFPSRVLMEKKGQKPRELTLAIRPGEMTTTPTAGMQGGMPGGMVPPPPPPMY
jgi:hypothetical protein